MAHKQKSLQYCEDCKEVCLYQGKTQRVFWKIRERVRA